MTFVLQRRSIFLKQFQRTGLRIVVGQVLHLPQCPAKALDAWGFELGGQVHARNA